MRALPSVLGLIAFDAVARHESFSRAGRELHVTQGAISHRIKALEEELGVPLFTRTPRHVQVTAAGQVLLRATHEAFGRLRTGLAEMDALRNPQRVTVSCSPSFAIRWLVPHLAELRRQAPDIDVHVSAEDALVQPAAGIIDLCIRFGGGNYPDVVAERLSEEQVTPVCSPLYVERHALQVPGDLARCRLLHDDVLLGHADHVGWAEWLDAAGLPDADLAGVHFSHSHLALDAAASGQGVALARTSLVRRQLGMGQLVAPFEVAIDSGLTYWLVTPTGTPPVGACRQFYEWLRRTLGAERGT